jgi:hypothetical protein
MALLKGTLERIPRRNFGKMYYSKSLKKTNLITNLGYRFDREWQLGSERNRQRE